MRPHENTLRWLAASCVTGLLVALVWLVWELGRAPEFVVEPEADRRDSGVTQSLDLRDLEPQDGSPTEALQPKSPELTSAASTALAIEALRAALESPAAVPREILLVFRSAADLAAFRARAALYGLRILSADGRLNAARVAYTDVDRLAAELSENAGAYASVGPNWLARIPGLPADLPEVDAANAGGRAAFGKTLMASIGADRDRSTWGRSVKVALLDSGVVDHPSLAGVRIERINLSEAPTEVHGHGTAMASLIVGRAAPADGVAQGAELIDIRLADADGMSNTALVANGIMTAVDRGARVINISLGAFGQSGMLDAAVQHALSKNVLIVAAAGNEQVNQLAIPAAIPGVISVGAADASRTQAYFSNSGEGLTLVAPGVGILSAFPGQQVVIGSGTSQAAAITSGAAATLLSWGYDAAAVRRILANNALKTGAPANQVGAGFLQIPNR